MPQGSPVPPVSMHLFRFELSHVKVVPPTAELGVLDDFSKPDKWVANFKIRRQAHFGGFFAYV